MPVRVLRPRTAARNTRTSTRGPFLPAIDTLCRNGQSARLLRRVSGRAPIPLGATHLPSEVAGGFHPQEVEYRRLRLPPSGWRHFRGLSRLNAIDSRFLPEEAYAIAFRASGTAGSPLVADVLDRGYPHKNAVIDGEGTKAWPGQYTGGCSHQSPAHGHASPLLVVSAVPRTQAAPALGAWPQAAGPGPMGEGGHPGPQRLPGFGGGGPGHARALRNPAPGTAGVDLRRRGSGSVLGAGGRRWTRRPATRPTAPTADRGPAQARGAAPFQRAAAGRRLPPPPAGPQPPVGPRPAHPHAGTRPHRRPALPVAPAA